MVRVGGVSRRSTGGKTDGQQHLRPDVCVRTEKLLDAGRDYTVRRRASVDEATKAPPTWDVVMKHIETKRVVTPVDAGHVRVRGA